MLNRVAFLSLIMLLFWAPLPFGSNVLWAEMLLACGCMLATCLTLSSELNQSGSRNKRLPYAYTPLLCLALASAYLGIQLLFGLKGTIEPMATKVQLLSSLALCCIFYMTIKTVTSEKRASIFLWTLIASGVFQACYGAAMTLSGMEYSFFLEKQNYRGVATGTFINRNHFAGYLVLILACGIGLMISGFRYNKSQSLKQFYRSFLEGIVSGKGALRVALIIMVIGLVLSRSRMGNASFFISMTLAGIAILFYAKVSKKTIGLFLASILVIDALIISSFFDLNKLVDRLENTSTETENRDEILQLSMPMLKENLWFGSGGGSFYTNYPAYRDASAGGGFYMHAHNDYVEFLSERGIIGCISLIAFYLLCMKHGMYLLKSGSNKKRGLGFTVLMSGIAIALHSSVDFNLQMPAYAVSLIAVWALAFSSPYLRTKQKTYP